MARGLDHDLGLEIADPIRRIRLVGAQLERPIQLVLDLVDGHDAHAVMRERGQHRGHADPAHADHGHRLPRRGAACVEDGATAGEHRTSQQGRHHRRHVPVDRHDRPAVDDGVGGERRDAEVMQDRGAVVAGQARPAGQQRARAVGGTARDTRCETVGGACAAVAAARQERHDDALPDGHVGNRIPDPLDDPGRLVAEQHRHRPDPVAVDHGQIGVAEPRGLDADEQLGVTRRREVEVGDGDRSRLGVVARCADPVEDGSADVHALQTAVPDKMRP